jgi:G3E family GTPase
MSARTPIALITGTLGSGKTTLVKRLIAMADRRLAVLMNEFGEIAIDSKIIQGENTRIVELAGGCVCCELTGEFVAAVDELIDKYRPELIVLEATGVAEADALVYEVEEELTRARLDSVVCIVDGYASIKYPQVG